MRKNFLLLLVFVFIGCLGEAEKPDLKKALFVLTSADYIKSADKKTGAYISEITHPYEVFKASGYEIDFISPKGGKVPLDGMENKDELTQLLWMHDAFRKKLETTLRPDQVKAKDYKVIFYAGGHGTMFDFPKNEAISKLAASVYENDGVVAAVCHGPAGLLNIKLSNGDFLVKGKKVTSFTNQEEDAVELTKHMPFLLESELINKGAEFVKADNFQKNVIVDERLITGQNPASARGVAQAVLETLKK